MPELLKVVARIIGWTLLQVLLFVIAFETGRAVASTFYDWQGDLGRGLWWWYYFQSFIGLALVANAALTIERIGRSRVRRLVVWLIVVVSLLALTLPNWPGLPLAIPFAHACALIAIVLREGLVQSARAPRWFASG